MNDIVFIKGLTVETTIGVYARERSIRQIVCLDIEMLTDISGAAGSDHIEDALDYKAIADRVTSYTKNSRFFLLEALAENIATLILDEFCVEWLRLRVCKPGAVQNADNVGIVIERGTRPASTG